MVLPLAQGRADGSGVARDATLVLDNDALRQAVWDEFYRQFNRADGQSVRAHYLQLVGQLGEFVTQNMLNAALNLGNEIELWQSTFHRAAWQWLREEICRVGF